MAKKKKSSKKKASSRKKQAESPREPNLFVRQVGSVLMLFVAVILLLGAFRTGGALPVGLFDVVYDVIGIAAFLSPVALAYWGVHKLRAEDHDLPLRYILSMGSLLIVSAAWLHVGFVIRNATDTEWEAGYGGGVGEVLGGAVLGAFDKLPASILFFILTVVAASWTFSIPLHSYPRSTSCSI